MQASADRRLRIAYLVPPTDCFAGIEWVVHEIASGLVEDFGHLLDVHVVFAHDYTDGPTDASSYTRHVLGVGRLRGLPGPLRTCAVRHRFDVLVCPQIEASVIAWLSTRGLPLLAFVTHLHGNPSVEERRGSWSTRLLFSGYRHVVARSVAGVLAVSPSLARHAARSVARRATVYVARNPLRSMPEPSAESNLAGFRFLNVARQSHQKGQDVLLEALANARPNLPAGTTLTLVGSGPDESELRRRTRELRLEHMVEFVPFTAHPEEYFATADCFVLPSRWEGFPLVLLEALSFGLPVLATDCDFGPGDLVTDDRTGRLVPIEDPVALADGLLRETQRATDEDGRNHRRSVARGYGRRAATLSHVEALVQVLPGDAGLRPHGRARRRDV